MSILEYQGDLQASDEKHPEEAIPIKTEKAMRCLFNRAAFDGERIIMTAGEAVFGIVPIEDIMLLNSEGLWKLILWVYDLVILQTKGILMGEEKYLKQEADEILDLADDSTDIMVDNYKDLELEMIKSTRDNFLIWKDYEY